jgi:phosphopantothenoylcysteine decarboxylase/phosphopantothenate--cysteine ligase
MIAPAMDLDMYHHAATQNNLITLRQRGVITIGPASGELASGLIGDGRMAEPSTIVNEVLRSFNVSNSLKSKQMVITAGPTREAIDPVRFISNHSTGKMGVAIAEEALLRGANVKLIIGKGALGYTNPNMEISYVDTAEEMLNASLSAFEKADIFIMSAAVADYTPEHVATQKIKKKDNDMSISLKRTPDILATLGAKKKKQLLVGFALETNNELEYAKNKLEKKNLDMIVLNSLQDAGAGFATDTNKISILDNNGHVFHFELKTKKMAAIDILNHVEKIMLKKY